ncbi:MAG: GNAT family N-acetyltransferase [Terracidiphilus sp.]|jgi:ribosomal-protein-alanine N-acetyltransferase
MNPKPQAVSVRPMTTADLDQVIEIAESLSQAPRWPRSAYLTALDPNATPRRIALVAQGLAANSVAGFAVASLIPPQAELEMIAVAPPAQRHGVARALFAALAAELRAALVTEVILEVRASNQPALELYRRIDFVVSGHRKRYYQSPVEDAVQMRLRL